MNRKWTWLLFVLLFFGAIEVLYLAAGNWALKSGTLAGLLSRKPEKFQIAWTSGQTTWPGIFHLEGVRIRGQSERMQTYVQMDRCTVRMHLALLAVCRVHFYRMEGEGFSLRMRRRQEPGKPRPLDRCEPPIPGLEQDAQPPTRKPYRSPWTLHFGSTTIKQIREIWIGPYRTTGSGFADGSVDYQLRGPLSVRRAVLRLEEASTAVGDEVIADHIQAELDATIASVLPRENRGRLFLRYLSGRYRVHGQVGGLRFLNEALGKRSAISFQGRGALSTDLTLDRGMVGPNSSISWEGQELLASAAGFTACGKGSLAGGTGPEGTSIRLAFHWSGITVTREGLPPISLDGPGLTTTAAGPRLDLASDQGELTLTVDLPKSKITDLSVIAPLLPPKAPITIRPGSPALISAHLELHGPSAKGRLFVNGARVGVGVGSQTLRGGFYTEMKVKEGDLQSGTFDISGSSVGFRDAALSDPGGPKQDAPWSGEALVSEGSVHTKVPGELKVKVKLKMTDTRPVIALFAANHKSVRWFKGFLDIKEVTGGAGLAVHGTTMALEGVDIRGKGLQMQGRMRLEGGRLDGAFYAQIHQLSAAVSIENGKGEWKLINARKWYDALP